MSARSAAHPGLVRSAAAALVDFLVEPAEPVVPDRRPLRTSAPLVVAVAGLAPRCGATVVARALGSELALRSADGACAVTTTDARGLGLGLPAAGRLARAVTVAGGGVARPAGRLCLIEAADAAGLTTAVGGIAPLVLDVADPSASAAAAALADAVVLVAAPATEPSLADALSASLARVGPPPLVVLTRARGEADRWDGRYAVRLPESRMGAQAALAGRAPRGTFGTALAELADRLER